MSQGKQNPAANRPSYPVDLSKKFHNIFDLKTANSAVGTRSEKLTGFMWFPSGVDESGRGPATSCASLSNMASFPRWPLASERRKSVTIVFAKLEKLTISKLKEKFISR